MPEQYLYMERRKMEQYIEKIIDLKTGTETIRKFTAEEIKETEAIQAQLAPKIEEMNKKEALRNSALSKLAALGLTEEEIAAL